MTQPKPNQILVDHRGRPTAVVFSLVNYQKLMRIVEDATDTTALKSAIRTSRGTISHHNLLARLKRQRLI